MPKATFNAKYNAEVIVQQEEQRQTANVESNDPKRMLQQQFEQYFKKATTEYQEYNFNEAIELLLKAIEIKYDHPEAQYLLARCYSINEDAENAINHLEAALAFGLKNPERIKTHDDLAFLRIQPSYEVFEANNYRRPADSLPKSEVLELGESTEPDLLEQLNQLQEQWESGKLTDTEFQLRQKELKSRDL